MIVWPSDGQGGRSHPASLAKAITSLRHIQYTRRSAPRGGDDAFGNAADGFHHQTGVERDDAIGTNPARRRKLAFHQIAGRERHAVLRLRPGGDGQSDEISP